MDIKKFVDERLLAFRNHTGMWGSYEAVELQALQLLEFEARSVAESAMRISPRLVLDLYAKELRARFRDPDVRPLHERLEPNDPSFGETLHSICTTVRSRIRSIGPRSASMQTALFVDDQLHSEVRIDGAWDLDDLSDFPKNYSQVYYFLYLAQHEFNSDAPERKDHIFSSYRWKGGYVYGTFFRELAKLVPPMHRPEIESIQYSSPGFIRLRLSRETATTIGRAIERFVARRKAIARAFKDALAWNRFCHQAIQSGDFVENYVDDLYRSTAELAEQLQFVDFDLLVRNTGHNVLIASNIMLAYFRRLDELARYRLAEKVRFM